MILTYKSMLGTCCLTTYKHKSYPIWMPNHCYQSFSLKSLRHSFEETTKGKIRRGDCWVPFSNIAA